jgi:hypothetical protein
MVEDQLVLSSQDKAVKTDVVAVLDRATTADLGFSLGRTPLNKFLKDNGGTLFQGVPDDRAAAATTEVKKLQRLYQVTPSGEAMKVLLDCGFTSAHQVTAMSREKFVDRYGGVFPSMQ